MLATRRRVLLGGLATLVVPSRNAAGANAMASALIAKLREGNHVMLMRHALAPGTGDPPGFRINDCNTQRNLNEAGRVEARRIGAALRTNGVPIARIYSSRWCRALETANLTGLGEVETMPTALDSFFAGRGGREASVVALQNLIESLPRDGANTLMVTHQVNITAISGIFPTSGEIVILPAGSRPQPSDVMGVLHF